MPVVLEYDIDQAMAQSYFDYVGHHVRSMTEPMRRIARLVHAFVEDQFDSEGATMSEGWEPLTPEYEKRKEADGYGGMPILQRTQDLLEDATTEPMTGLGLMHAAPGGLRYGNGWLVFDPISMHYGSTGKYPVELVDAHQHGTENMVERPIWQTTEAFETGARKIMAGWLNEVKTTAGHRRNPGFDFAPVIAA